MRLEHPIRIGRCLPLVALVTLTGCVDSSAESARWTEGTGHRWTPLAAARGDRVGFETVDPVAAGLRFRNALTEDQIVENRNLLNGSGVAIGDVDGDGRADIYLARLDGPNRLYRNLGDWRFEDVTDSAGVALPDQFSTGTVFADLDGDDDLDLVVAANGAPTRLFLNDGSGVFDEAEGAFAEGGVGGGTSLAVADLDGDTDLDVYLARYKARSVRDVWPYEQEFRFIVERVDGEYRVREKYRDHYQLELRDSVLVWFEQGEPDLLFLNEGEGRFRSPPLDGGVLLDEDGSPIRGPLRDWGLHARFHDLDGDRWPDLYVANDFESPDRIWMNQGDGTLRALPRLSTRKGSVSAMAVDFSDVDRDGTTDFFVVEMLSRDHARRLRQMGTMAPSPQPVGAIANQPQYMGNTLFLARGDGTYAEVGEQAGLRRSDWSWSTTFLDVDLDGFEDLLVATGHHYDVQDSDANTLIRNRTAQGRLDMERVMLMYPPLAVSNALFRNRGDGTFEDATGAWGFGDPDVSHGTALGDLDGDGDLDVVINRLGYDVALHRNLASAPRVVVRLRGEAGNTRGVGSTIRFLGGPVDQTKEIVAGGTYLSGSEATAVFAAGDGDGPFRVEVLWRSGRTSVIDGVRPGRLYEVFESAAGAPAPPAEAEPEPGPLFEPAMVDLPPHAEDDYPDFSRHPLLPYRLSRLGPGLAWFDPHGDGSDDLFVGNGSGAGVTWLRNEAGMLREATSGLAAPRPGDVTGLVGWREDGVARLLVARSRTEANEDPGAEAVEIWEVDGAAVERRPGIPGWGSSPGPLALGDVDGDGRLDLFVGGRVVPDRYPEPASSRLFLNRGDGRFEADGDAGRVLDRIGLVTGAVFADLDGDARPELVVTREWDSPAVFTFSDGRLVDVSERWGVAGRPGWWNGVGVGDLDGDGRLDLVLTNWGRNHAYAATSDEEHPVRIRYGDLDGDGDVQVIETYHRETDGAEVPRRGFSLLWDAFPWIQDRVETYEAFAASTVDEVFGGRLRETASVEAWSFDHVVLLNRGDGFEVSPLPPVAQHAPAFHASVADVDGDGAVDLLLSQNFFAYQLEMPRSDAGRGLLLRGDGHGGFTPVDGGESGIRVWGEQRGAAVSDVDGDGRTDFAVTQNGAPTRLLLNRRGAPGLRVRLVGPPENPQGVGAHIRLEGPDGPGPARAILAGSGYWSMDSVVPVVARPAGEVTLWVRWPDGSESRAPVPAGAREVVAERDGTLRVTREET